MEFQVVEAFDVEIVESERLSTAVRWIAPERIALIRRGLDRRDREWVADWLLPRVVESLSHPPRQTA